MHDLVSLKASLSLPDMVAADLGEPAKRSGGALFWPCPFHGERTPSLAVYPDHFHCFGCRERGDAIAWTMKRRQLSFRDACELLAGGRSLEHAPAARPQSAPVRRAQPAATWRERAAVFVAEAEAHLWAPEGEKARRHLAETRGLSEQTLRAFRLGYQPEYRQDPSAAWGLDDDKPVWLPQGIVLPTLFEGLPMAVRIRRPAGEPKYLHVRGGTPGLFGFDALTGQPALLLCEGELDACLAHTCAGDLVDCASFGSAGHKAIDVWLPLLRYYTAVLVAGDHDRAGAEMLAFWAGNMPGRARAFQAPSGKDIGEYWKAGGDVRAWIAAGAEQQGVNSAGAAYLLSWPTDAKPATVAGKWRRLPDGSIEAEYTRDELALALAAMGIERAA